MATEESVYLIDQFLTTKIGDPFRLFPFGALYRGGSKRQLTAEYARLFKLPHFKPPIKRGSHRDETPAAGHLVGLEVRDDGLYGIPEWNDEGLGALARGEYRYHSPEVIWEGWVEDAVTGEQITGPLIVGVALLHNPALGEAAALYRVDTGDRSMSENYEVPAGLWARFNAWLDRATAAVSEPEPEPEPAPVAPAVPEDYEALKAQAAELEQYRAQVEQLKAEQARAARVAHFAAALADAPALAGDAEAHEILAGLADDVAERVLGKFRALAAQIDESNLTEDVGAAGSPEGGPDAYAVLQEAIKAQVDKGLTYNAAIAAVAKEQPALFGEIE
jgi:hypothetical protein